MANSIGSREIIVDTPSAVAVMTVPLSVRIVRWVGTGATTAGHECKVTDPVTGRTLWQSFAVTANHQEESSNLVWQNGFTVPILASGTLFVYP